MTNDAYNNTSNVVKWQILVDAADDEANNVTVIWRITRNDVAKRRIITGTANDLAKLWIAVDTAKDETNARSVTKDKDVAYTVTGTAKDEANAT